ncbi:MAG: Tol-Pal system beta propeller repeat protein TolB [Wigglesworthia glossinidia]|nr:Tol-Pal system beta propeller repeat protein TolB [Wigglesworthia glossinidia]
MNKLLLIFYSIFFYNSILHANIHININQGIDIPAPIGIYSFKWKENNLNIKSDDIGNIIAYDLQNSGKFSPIEISDNNKIYLHQFTRKTLDTSSIPKNLNINTLLLGKISLNKQNEYLISYKLIDLINNPGKILLNSYRTAQIQSFRKVAHDISNEIFKKLTGITGAFHTRIAYIIYNKNNEYPYQLCIADYDGYNQKVIHQSNMPLMSPSWSPDEENIAYVTFEYGNSAIKIKNLKNGSIRHIANFPYHNGAPAFSPDGEKLAFVLSKTGSLNLYIMFLKSGLIKQITNNSNNNTEPSWFPNNKELTYTSDQNGNPQIYKINIHNKKSDRISWEGSKNQNSEVSSDGTFLAMVNSEKKEQHIALLDLKLESTKILTKTFLDEAPSISPNNTMIIYKASYKKNSSIELISTNGRFKKSILKIDGQIKFPRWSQKI